MRVALISVSLLAFLGACGDSSFSSSSSDAGSADGSSADGSVTPNDAGSSDGGRASAVAVRDYNQTSGSIADSTPDTPVVVKIPGGAEILDVVIAVIAIYQVNGDKGTTIVAPPEWQPSGSYFDEINGGNLSAQWHMFAYAAEVTAPTQSATFTIKGLTTNINSTSWYATLVAYSGTSLQSIDFKDINDSNGVPYLAFPAVIVSKDGSHVFSGMIAQGTLPTPLLGLPANATEIGGAFMTGLGRLVDEPVATAGNLDAYTIPTGPDGGAIPYYSTTFQFVISPR